MSTGLGLNYVNQAMKRLGGTVDVASEIGKGTIFSLYFPLALPPAAAKPVRVPLLQRDSQALLRRSDSISEAAAETNRQPDNTKGLRRSAEQLEEMKSMALKARVLVVEDDPVNAKILRRVFEKAGYDVSWAEDGLKGYQTYIERPFHLIIEDVMMPV